MNSSLTVSLMKCGPASKRLFTSCSTTSTGSSTSPPSFWLARLAEVCVVVSLINLHNFFQPSFFLSQDPEKIVNCPDFKIKIVPDKTNSVLIIEDSGKRIG